MFPLLFYSLANFNYPMANPMMSNYPFNPSNMMYNNSYNPFNTNTNINVKNNNSTAVNNKQGLSKTVFFMSPRES